MAEWGPPRRSGRRGTVRPGEQWGEYVRDNFARWVRRRDGHVWGTPDPNFHQVQENVMSNDNRNSYRSNSVNSASSVSSASTANTEPYSENGNAAEIAGLGPQPLSRQQSALERYQSIEYTREGEQTDLVMVPEPGPLERFYSVEQARVRFVLYTSDADIIQSFTDGNGDYVLNHIQLLYNSSQLVPIDYVFVDNTDAAEVASIRARLPQSVQYIGEGFGNTQMMDSITTDSHFLLTIEPDTDRPNPPIFGMLCCSFETATISSQNYTDAAGNPILNFQSAPHDVYLYVHLFTFLGDRATGDEFFTGSHMLEGLYLLFNYEQDNMIIYLEAIDVQPTLDFYDRFGMERLPRHPVSGTFFDPFKNLEVPNELPYVLYDHNQMQVASVLAFQARQARVAGNRTRIMALVEANAHAALQQPLTDEDREMIERSVSIYNHTRARRDPRPPRY